MNPLKIVYFGTPHFSARLLEKIINDSTLPLEIVTVVTRPDKPVGRTQTITPSAVKLVAQAHNIPVVHTITPEELTTLGADLCLVYSYGKILPDALLRAPKHGFWNIHPSLLPLFRGASPTAYTLLMGNEATGCTLMKMDAFMDHGSIIAQDTYTVSHLDSHETLLEKLTYVGYMLFRTYTLKLMDGTFTDETFSVQNDSLATFTRLLTREDGFIELALLQKALRKEKIVTDELPQIIKTYISQNTVNEFPILYAPFIVFNMFRGLHPWPGVWTTVMVQGSPMRLKLLDMDLTNDTLTLKTVQLEGKQPVPFEQFQRSYAIIEV